MRVMKVSASEFQQSFGLFRDKATREPIVITEHGQDSLVVMSTVEWARLRRGDRRVGLATELPEEWIRAVEMARVPEEFAALDEELD